MAHMKLTLQIPVSICVPEDVPIESIKMELEDLFTTYEDGRFPYQVESVKHALRECLQIATINALYGVLRHKYKGEYIHRENSSQSKSSFELEHLAPRVVTYVLGTDKIELTEE
jgi:hypothetical protein